MRWTARSICLVSTLTACSADVQTLSAPCPCLAGFTCCAARNVCLRDGSDDCPRPPAVSVVSITPSQGPVEGATRVRIQGVGFSADAAVRFGGADCLDVEVEDDRNLTCTTPPGAPRTPTVDVRVDAAGARAFLTAGFRYVLAPFIDVVATSGLGTSDRDLALAVADFDGAPGLDVLLTNASDAGLHANDGRGRFALATEFWIDRILQGKQSVTAGDFTGDGRTDAFVTQTHGPPGYGSFATLVRQTDDGFDRGPEPVLATMDSAVMDADAVDFDGDGDLDVIGARLVLGRPVEHPIFLALNEDGALIEQPGRVTYSQSSLHGYVATAIGDYDRDGDPDLLACGSLLLLMEADGGRLVDRTQSAGLPRFDGACGAVAWVDFDGDGDLDIAAQPLRDGSAVTAGTVLLENALHPSGEARFAPTAPLDLDVNALACTSFSNDIDGASLHAGANDGVWFDADHDGDIDLLLPQPFIQCALPPMLYESRFAQGEFGFMPRFVARPGVLGGHGGVAAADVDDDGDLDVVLGGWGVGARRALLHNNLGENSGTSNGPRGRALFVRAPRGVTVELDTDGPEESPDFALGAGKLQVRVVGAAGRGSSGPGRVHFGLGATPDPVWVRAGGVVRRVPAGETSVDLTP